MTKEEPEKKAEAIAQVNQVLPWIDNVIDKYPETKLKILRELQAKIDGNQTSLQEKPKPLCSLDTLLRRDKCSLKVQIENQRQIAQNLKVMKSNIADDFEAYLDESESFGDIASGNYNRIRQELKSVTKKRKISQLNAELEMQQIREYCLSLKQKNQQLRRTIQHLKTDTDAEN